MLALHNKNIENISMFTLKLFTSSDYHLHFTLTGYRLSTAGRTSLFRVEPRGQTGRKLDLPRSDRWDEWTRALSSTRWDWVMGGSGRGRGQPASQASRDCPRVCGGGTSSLFSWWSGCAPVFSVPWTARDPVPRLSLRLLVAPPRPFPRPAPVTVRARFQCLGTSRPRLMWVSSPGLRWPLGSPRSREAGWARRGAREGRGGVGPRRESVLPGRLWLWAWAAVGASPARAASRGPWRPVGVLGAAGRPVCCRPLRLDPQERSGGRLASGSF